MNTAVLTLIEKKLSHKLEFEARDWCSFTESDYLYHATSIEALPSIKSSGLLTRDERNLVSLDPSKDAFISAAKTIRGAGSLASGFVILRIKPAVASWKEYGANGEVRSMQTVPPENLEIQEGRSWRPL